MNKFLKYYITSAYLPILILALLLRVTGLNLNPVGITHDEIHDLINAKSMALTGWNAPGTVAGIFSSNNYCDGNCIFGEFVSFWLVPWMKLMPLDPFWSKVPFLLADLGIVYFGGKLFENLSGKKRVGLLASLMIAVNPWAIHFGRTAYENLFTFWFYLWTLYLLTLRKMRGSDMAAAILIGFLGSLSYFGAKPIYPLIIMAGGGYQLWINKFKNWKPIASMIGLGVIITITYVILLKNSAAGLRMAEIKAADMNQITNEVNEQRRMSLEIPIVRDMVVNKYWVTGKIILNRYLNVFNPKYLFSQGEDAFDVFMISNQALMYLVDGLFAAIGIISLGGLTAGSALLGAVILIVPIPAAISSVGLTYALRAGLLFPMLCGLAAIGINSVYDKLKNIQLKWLMIAGITGIYLLSFGYFQIMYWYRTPFEKSAAWVFHERALIKYIGFVKLKSEKPILVVTKDPVDLMYLYGFYSKKYNDKEFAHKMNESILNGSYVVDNIKFTKSCPAADDKNTLFMFEADMNCVKEPHHLPRIAEARDAGTRFAFPEDIACNDITLRKYPYPRKIEDFRVEDMGREKFCQTWITQP